MTSPYLEASAQAGVLHVGIILREEPESLAVHGRLIADLQAAPFLRLTLIRIRLGERNSGRRAPWRWLLSRYRRWDRQFGMPLKATTIDPSLIRDQVNVVVGDPQLQTALTSRRFDVILCPKSFSGMEQLAGLATHGVWWIAPGPSLAESDGYWQYFLSTASGHTPVVEAVWALHRGDGVPVPTVWASARSVSRLSVTKNIAPLEPIRRNLWLSALRTLAVSGWERLVAKSRQMPAPDAHAEANVFSVGGLLAGMAGRQVRERWRRYNRVELWEVGIRPLRTGDRAIFDGQGYRWLEPKKGHWYADPFLVPWRGKELIFVEDFDEGREVGHIACAEISADGAVGEFRPVLVRPYHLSYPHVFEHGGEWFMVPESGLNNTVELYRAISFPDQWELVRVLYRGAAFDTTVLYAEDKFWFLTSLVEDAEHEASQLLMYSSDRIDGDWRLHPASPLSNDSRVARNAGGILRLGSRLVRPAQDGSHVYGGQVNFREIVALNEQEYEERDIGSLLPLPGGMVTGLHTYNRGGLFETIDRRIVLTQSSGKPSE